MAQYNVNLHPSFFEQDFPPQRNQTEIVSKGIIERELPVDLNSSPQKEYRLFSPTKGEKNYAHEMTRGIHNLNPLANKFASAQNIKNLQNQLRYSVFVNSGGRFNGGVAIKGTGHIVGEQDVDQMIVIMRYIYLQYGKHTPNVEEEVKRLNKLFIREATPNVIVRAESHLGYLRDASRLPDPISLPVATNSSGLKNYRSTTEVLGVEDTS